MNTQYPRFTLSGTLTSEQHDFFEEHGFIHFKHFIDPGTVQAIIDAAEQVAAQMDSR